MDLQMTMWTWVAPYMGEPKNQWRSNMRILVRMAVLPPPAVTEQREDPSEDGSIPTAVTEMGFRASHLLGKGSIPNYISIPLFIFYFETRSCMVSRLTLNMLYKPGWPWTCDSWVAGLHHQAWLMEGFSSMLCIASLWFQNCTTVLQDIIHLRNLSYGHMESLFCVLKLRVNLY